MEMVVDLLISGKISFCDSGAQFRTDNEYIKGFAEYALKIVGTVEGYRKNYGDTVAGVVFNTINSWRGIPDLNNLLVGGAEI